MRVPDNLWVSSRFPARAVDASPEHKDLKYVLKKGLKRFQNARGSIGGPGDVGMTVNDDTWDWTQQ